MYREVKKRFLGANSDLVPEEYWSNFVNLGGAFEANYIIAKLLVQGGIEKGRVLIVGVFGGRDYFGLLLKGYDVYGFDCVDIEGFQRLKVGNVEERLPYPDEQFDAVVMGEVLEHLKYDANALANINRVLKKNGALVLTVPFLNDKPEYHIRVHTRNSCRRLLESCGFQILNVVERPAIWKIPAWMNWIHHLIGWVSLKIFGFLPHRIVLPFWANIEFKLGQIHIPIRRWSRGFGGYYLCKKTASEELNYVSLNQQEFGNKRD